MNAKTYCRELYNRLCWHFPEQKAREVAEDYRDLMEAGRSDGQSEEGMIASFGDPKAVAGELARERKHTGLFPGGVVSFLPLRKRQTVFGAVIFILLGILSLPDIYLDWTAVIFMMIPIACLRPFYGQDIAGFRPAWRQKTVPAALAFLFLCALALLIWAFLYGKAEIFDRLTEIQQSLIPGETERAVGRNLMWLLQFSMLFSLLLYLLIYVCNGSKLLYHAVTLLALSVFFTGRLFMTVLRGMDVSSPDVTPEMLSSILETIVKEVGAAVAAAVLAAVLAEVIRRVAGRVRHG